MHPEASRSQSPFAQLCFLGSPFASLLDKPIGFPHPLHPAATAGLHVQEPCSPMPPLASRLTVYPLGLRRRRPSFPSTANRQRPIRRSAEARPQAPYILLVVSSTPPRALGLMPSWRLARMPYRHCSSRPSFEQACSPIPQLRHPALTSHPLPKTYHPSP